MKKLVLNRNSKKRYLCSLHDNRLSKTFEDTQFYKQRATSRFAKAMWNEDFDKILDYIYGCEFDIEINENGTINLIDEQGVYLGGASSYENFGDIFEACGRLSIYLEDYFGIEVY